MSEALELKIKEQGDIVRKLKADKATKDQVKICAVRGLKCPPPSRSKKLDSVLREILVISKRTNFGPPTLLILYTDLICYAWI